MITRFPGIFLPWTFFPNFGLNFVTMEFLYIIKLYTPGQTFSDFLRVKFSNKSFGIATKMLHFVIWTVLSILLFFKFLVLIRYASVGI